MPSKIVWAEADLLALPKTRGAAISAGVSHYYTAVACRRGHLTARHVAHAKCLDCFREASRLRTARLRAKGNDGTARTEPRAKHGLTGSVAMMLYLGAQNRARKKGVEFTIHVTDIVIPECCPILGTPIDQGWGCREQTSKGRQNAPSLDRIDPRKGYIPGNIAVISYRANMIKGDGLPSEHWKVAAFMRARETRAQEIDPAPQLAAE